MHDVVVVGAGGCGLMAALVAAVGGVDVLVLEKTGAPGGGTAYSHRGVRAAGTRYQQERGIADSAEQYAEEILRRNGYTSDPVVTAHLAAISSRVVHFLADHAGVRFSVDGFTFGQKAARSHVWDVDAPITDLLFAAVDASERVTVEFGVAVRSLLRDAEGSVVGADTDRGLRPGRKVILASGGFAADSGMLSRYIPAAVGIPFPGHPGSTGDGIAMGVAAGAALAHMGAFQPYPAHVGPGKRAVPPDVIMDGAIVVDAGGERFIDETRYPGGLATAILERPGKTAYEILDQHLFERYRQGPPDRSLAPMAEEGLLATAETAQGLAAALGIDAAGLASTLEARNATVGIPDRFGRTFAHALEAPLYGIRITVAIYHTQGGLEVNAHGQVLRPDGTTIANLYAGGGAAAGLSGDGLDGYLPGNGLLASLGLGLAAAEHAVASLPG